MFLVLFVGLAGGLATVALVEPSHGLFLGLLAAPLGGSALASVAVAFLIWRTRHADLDELADEMVADLRGVSAERSDGTRPAGRKGAAREVA
ncbi:hypothetical protein [Salinarimonas soli]|uniref:Uncharacterized protein n=1 Tax=Salinarimonas soli TaxID=1638099 RepID=A0A5B2VYC8_9HYPH|nr:hypothetical protein [Salinarimonas soli]KAA2244401.1 hypothetical protein F0L46_00440 [Salinarimonas soli]